MLLNSKLTDMRRVRYFVGVCQAGGFSQASRVLNVAQSALSLHIANLEADLGLKLLVRSARGVSATEAGERLLSAGMAVLEMLEQVENDVRALAVLTSGPAMVGLSYSITEAIGLPFVETMLADLTSVRLRILEGHSEALNYWLATGEIDLALNYLPSANERILSEPVLEEQLFCLGTADLLGTDPKPITFAEVLELPLVAPGRKIVMHAILSDPEVQERVARKSIIELEGLSIMKQVILKGLGCCIHTRAFVAPEVRDGRLIARPIVEPEIKRTVYLSGTRVRSASRAVMETRRVLLETVERAHADGVWPGIMLNSEV